MLTLMTLVLALDAQAADATWMPDALQGGLTLGYDGTTEFGDLVEGGEVISGRRVTGHGIGLRAEFSPVAGLALNVGFDTTPSLVYAFPDARPMLADPVNDSGSYLNSEPFPEGTETSKLVGRGMEGVWIGAAFSPFNEKFERVDDRLTWRLDFGWRSGVKNKNLWTAGGNGRGAADGGSAIKLGGAFSFQAKRGNPYLKATYIKEGKVTVDVSDELGNQWVNGLEVQPGSSFDTVTGIEIIGHDREDSRFAWDLFLGLTYNTWENIPSGVYLPSVIDRGRTITVTSSEHLSTRAGMGPTWRILDNVRGRAGATFHYTLPYTLEHTYDVRTSADTVGIGWYVSLTGMLGQADFPTEDIALPQ